MRTYRTLPSGSVDRAKDLRRNATEAEKRRWRALRDAFPEAKFRRQVPMGPYFADFLSFSLKLIIEVDGGQHSEAATYDAARTRFLSDEGYRVLRFWNNDVLANSDGVIAKIANSLSQRERVSNVWKDEGDEAPQLTHSPSPSHSAMLSGPALGELRPAQFRSCRGHDRPNAPLPLGEGKVGEGL